MNQVTSRAQRLPRRTFLAAAAAFALPAAAQGSGAPRPAVFAEVWKDPNCGCCADWVKHLEANGFKVKVNDSGNGAMRGRLGVPAQYGSCHTALIGGYAIEGHVPARDIHRLLREKPQAVGLAVPGMPVGSPGMDGAIYGGRKDAYEVLLLQRSGAPRVWQAYPGATA
ncbi:DUF411 domain-containing protein [Ramlibacter sp. AN1015]|uniref:DUF411 domain-containing protein n=1 Tax=Ramlibacter sp. AN1015 TaxID=3133428 RepID=UPI0030C4AC22